MVGFLVFLGSFAFADTDHRVDLKLSELVKPNGARALPAKFLDVELGKISQDSARFSPSVVISRSFVEAKSQEWEACHQKQARYGLFQQEDDQHIWKRFFEFGQENLASTLEEMEQRKLRKAKLTETPWSGDFWPIANGILGARYFTDLFTNLKTWLERFEFVQQHSVATILEKNGQTGIDALSPAEKYDLLVGDEKNGFARAQWAEGQRYHDETGKVEEWMGICHGWAPASFMEPRPLHLVEATAKGASWKLKLYPSEIKGLLSYSWAYNQYPNKSVGHRCNTKDPKLDENGRLLEPECLDINPATWHKLVVNHIGVFQRSVIMDATYDYEVWNQPIWAYSYSYFNPQTNRSTVSLEKAKVKREDFPTDRFAKHRSPKAKTLVGIVMRVGYTIEVRANDRPTNGPEYDHVRWVEYFYDLELDDENQLVGGEWYQTAHPDFLWSPVWNAKPTSPLDKTVEKFAWTGDEIPNEWSYAAKLSSPYGIVLDTITKALVERASTP